MKKRILKYSVLLVIIGVSVLGLFTSALARYFYQYEVENSIENTAKLISYQVKQLLDSSQAVDYDKIAKDYAKLLNTETDNKKKPFASRITLIDFQGNVLGESDSNVSNMENHIDRNEVKEAIGGKIGKDQRFSETLKLTYLYIALPLEEDNIIVRVSVPLYQLNAINRTFFYYSILGILIGILLTIPIAIQLSRVVTNPVQALISSSQEIANGNYRKRVDIKSKDEIGQLAETYNEMAFKLDQTLTGMLDRNIRFDTVINSMTDGIIAVDANLKIMIINTIACEIFGLKHEPEIIGKGLIDITRNNKVISLLRETIKSNTALTDEITMFSPSNNSDKIFKIYTNPVKSLDSENPNSGGVITLHDVTSIKKLEDIRTEFVSNVTHELKTPLTSIRGFVETLKSGAIEDPSVSSKFLDIIDIEAERLYMLINDILQLSEIEGMKSDENVQQNNLNSIVEEVILILEPAASKKNVNIQVNTDSNINIMVNKNRIKQMLINLIDNAIKYNIENGSVFVTTCKSNGKTVISIKDTGIGIPENHHSRIFERFYRVDKGRSRNMGGTGLGLSIVKHIVNLYKGDIRIISEPGKGTEFIIQLPL